jgi:hypothetical protein
MVSTPNRYFSLHNSRATVRTLSQKWRPVARFVLQPRIAFIHKPHNSAVVLQIGFRGGMYLSTLHAATKADSQYLIYRPSYVAKSEIHCMKRANSPRSNDRCNPIAQPVVNQSTPNLFHPHSNTQRHCATCPDHRIIDCCLPHSHRGQRHQKITRSPPKPSAARSRPIVVSWTYQRIPSAANTS